MVEKRRGLGRGLGALIPSAPAPEETEPTPMAGPAAESGNSDLEERPQGGGRPVDLFFERVTESGLSDAPRSYSSALRSGINRNVLEAQTKRVAKSSSRKPGKASGRPSSEPAPGTTDSSESLAGQVDGSRALSDGSTEGRAVRAEVPERPTEKAVPGKPDSQSKPVSQAVSRETPLPAASGTAPGELGAGDGANELVQVPGASFAEVLLDDIHPNRKQPRVEFNEDELAELVHSIREIGVLQPIVVRPSQEQGGATYELVMGERRWRASREAGLASVPAIIRTTLDDDLLRDALLENLHRSALNPLEEAAAYQQLLDDFGCSHDELAGRLGRSRPQISNTLRLMKLPPLVQRRVAAGVLSAGHARALLGLAEPAEMEKLAQRIVSEGLSVRSTEEIVALSGGLRRASRPSTVREGARHERLDYLATSLSDRLDTNVKITLGAKKGRVSIEFASVDDLNRIVAALSPGAE
ncbi:ParB/RepB/Spo0J family partition protein [Arthrobacter agilis]|uniref:ParB/RepB/Spo0J family partition protein n=1 Tax=Arthrobacter agilis TaxID=37921 RepID=UPI0023660F0D|nr:ParB/RepB/Spo0J family partition protein [Arthrobacter agilis]WDF33367.1 ParB/RepB/Spo0J family partition protein [Arthrobacter agilis]